MLTNVSNMSSWTRAPAVLAAALLALAALFGGCSKPEPPNVVFVTIDTLRADHLGCYGYFRDTSPVIDGLARESVFFSNCIAPMATTLPSHTSLFTGTYPLEHGILANVEFGGFRFTPSDKLRSLAELARDEGYATAAFVSATPLKKFTGMDAGFDVYDEPSGKERRAAKTNAAAFEWLDKTASEPFFMWVHYYDPHYTYAPPPPYDTMFRTDAGLEAFLAERAIPPAASHELRGVQKARPINNAYDGEVRYTDDQLGKLIKRLEDKGVWERTILVLIADHGEGLAQHNDLGHGAVWNEQLQVPLMIRVPGLQPRRITETMSLIDVVPTLLALAPELPFEGIAGQTSGGDATSANFRPLPVLSQEVGRDRPGRGGPSYSLTTGEWKYVYSPEGDDQLFNLTNDPHEMNDLWTEDHEIGKRLLQSLQERIGIQAKRGVDLREGQENEQIQMDDKTLEELKKLGYF